ncbi:uncharacterized protein K452DRAFT_294529 [Aplosporella prunicola CBS 121167]|uniref:CID domain-containing protein n=1 Tax=Aplosporella prunicola CBS 121167 TaxID=1176127 RepID=A0A6A6BP31_9PEZI|nr:uncharacterized protein K452DRAFT_294529 [Aplosporella prunicola CBS 121167]KAF2145890.1 hypothetical protein K452DRAFT_294529 [Aplosporella prunicola CBS 121167]
MSSLASDEVAADFRDALQDLKMNSRAEITNLTIIAKENTEHAQAISRELENHVRSTRPEWKLPALYVLDSIVKNVGTPYTVYLGRNLYNTFVNTYTLVDNPTRKALEGLLRTWKQPVPESMETRPVFPVDVTRAIDNVLLKFKTVAMQQQHQTRSPAPLPGADARPAPSPFGFPPGTAARQSPAQNGMPFAPPQMPALQSPAPSLVLPYALPAQAVRQSPAPAAGLPFMPPAAQPVPSAEKILADVERLIQAAKMDFATNIRDPEKQKRLQTFLDLQTVLKSQQLSPKQLEAVEMQLANLGGTTPPQPSVSAVSAPAPMTAPMAPPFTIPTPTPQFPSMATPVPQSATPVPISAAAPAAPPSLADMLRGFNRGTTPVQAPLPAPSAAPIIPPVAPAAAPPSGLSLVDLLRAQGLLGGSAAPTPTPAMPHSAVPPSSSANDVELTKDSIKRPRPALLNLLYDARPNQCSTCGRRFPSTDEGKVMKRRHLDWHFKVRDPNIVKQAIHRSWYIGEKEWIEYREQDEAKPPPETNGASTAAAKTSQVSFVRVPLDPELVNAPCPICQEKFTPSRLDDEFVWMDALQVGPKIYHASCYEEVYGKARGTPVSVLGKRSADEGYGTPTTKKMVV